MRYGHSTMTGRWGQYHVVGESRYHVHGDHYAWKVVPHVHTITTGEEIRCDQALLVKRQSFPTPSRMVEKSGHALLQTPRSGRSWARIGSFKHFCASASGARPLEPPAPPAGSARSGSPSRAPRSKVESGAARLSWCWTRAAGRERGGLAQGEDLGKGGLRNAGGKISKRDFSSVVSPPHEAHLHSTPHKHISIPRLTSTSPLYASRPRDHTRRRGSGAGCPPLRWVLGDPVERFLARMGGGTAASFRCRRMRVITASWVIAAMIRSEPWRQNGQRLERVREFHDDSSRQDFSGVYHRSGLVLFSRVP